MDLRPSAPTEELTPTPQPVAAAVLSGEVHATDAPRPLSVFDMFRVGIGPSSSHTVGPMRAGLAFTTELASLPTPSRLHIDLFGSLGATGRGHNTDRAVLLGLAGFSPESVSIDTVESLLPGVARSGHLPLPGAASVPFDLTTDIRFLPGTVLPYHVNALTISAWVEGSPGEAPALVRTYYSVGGGFVMAQVNDDTDNPQVEALASASEAVIPQKDAPFPFASSDALLAQCDASGLSVAQLVRANELSLRSEVELDAYLDQIANTMFDCVDAGVGTSGILPGGLDVPRRAGTLARKLAERARVGAPSGSLQWAATAHDPMRAMDWVNLFALAVNEENAAGHRIVTAPTNGAAGVIPAVLGYLVSYCPEAGASDSAFVPSPESPMAPFQLDPSDLRECAQARRRVVHDFVLAATAIGALIKTNASIAGAEVGCQGEVGSASAMAAAGLAQALGGTPQQVENAAEIAMEHSLGLTCDPVAGLVQIPCIERNAIAAVKAINAARMALWGDGRHTVSLDVAIETMRQTGIDMLSKYKETSAGGLAVNVVEC
ncbi:L-serine ammonia-lyase, iron-sulfur-dependent, subunit alpha [Schaalia sp. Marseille-Q2122]|uniref:L-serine ammonia-lyase, iron-sulfur-dependent, subunit alpha n=1 Tax=Schaalia sp. Marseille-Q2122 TaxID=2736604 RepID=UPI00158C86C1|nr:L-serine ammonia-lyase, iron-sulfur-dependent, subunit alpha [Schaalia sp. Marseille-Q2122]